MSNLPSSRPTRRATRRNDPRTLLKFVEELSWLLSSYEELDFRALGALSSEFDKVQRATANLAEHSSRRAPTAQLLVGTLPGLLTDETLFPSNEDIIEFSMIALSITIPRWQKKSRYELIGHIVCNADMAGPSKLNNLVALLDGIMSDKGETRRNVAEQRKQGLSWNEVIQGMIKNRDV